MQASELNVRALRLHSPGAPQLCVPLAAALRRPHVRMLATPPQPYSNCQSALNLQAMRRVVAVRASQQRTPTPGSTATQLQPHADLHLQLHAWLDGSHRDSFQQCLDRAEAAVAAAAAPCVDAAHVNPTAAVHTAHSWARLLARVKQAGLQPGPLLTHEVLRVNIPAQLTSGSASSAGGPAALIALLLSVIDTMPTDQKRHHQRSRGRSASSDVTRGAPHPHVPPAPPADTQRNGDLADRPRRSWIVAALRALAPCVAELANTSMGRRSLRNVLRAVVTCSAAPSVPAIFTDAVYSYLLPQGTTDSIGAAGATGRVDADVDSAGIASTAAVRGDGMMAAAAAAAAAQACSPSNVCTWTPEELQQVMWAVSQLVSTGSAHAPAAHQLQVCVGVECRVGRELRSAFSPNFSCLCFQQHAST